MEVSGHESGEAGALREVLGFLENLTQTATGAVIYDQIARVVSDFETAQDRIEQTYSALLFALLDAYSRNPSSDHVLEVTARIIRMRQSAALSLPAIAALRAELLGEEAAEGGGPSDAMSEAANALLSAIGSPRAATVVPFSVARPAPAPAPAAAAVTEPAPARNRSDTLNGGPVTRVSGHESGEAGALREVLGFLENLTQTATGAVIYDQIARVVSDFETAQDRIEQTYSALLFALLDAYSRNPSSDHVLEVTARIIRMRQSAALSLPAIAALRAELLGEEAPEGGGPSDAMSKAANALLSAIGSPRAATVVPFSVARPAPAPAPAAAAVTEPAPAPAPAAPAAEPAPQPHEAELQFAAPAAPPTEAEPEMDAPRRVAEVPVPIDDRADLDRKREEFRRLQVARPAPAPAPAAAAVTEPAPARNRSDTSNGGPATSRPAVRITGAARNSAKRKSANLRRTAREVLTYVAVSCAATAFLILLRVWEVTRNEDALYVTPRTADRPQSLAYSAFRSAVAPILQPAPATPGTDQDRDMSESSSESSSENSVEQIGFQHPAFLLELIGAQPEYEGGRFVGFRAAMTEATDFTKAIGIEPGDIVAGVNGIAFGSEAQATALLDELSGHGRLTFTILRNGQTLVLI